MRGSYRSDTLGAMAGDNVYVQIVDAANELYGAHSHSRALHAKGTWCAGTFTATPEAAELCRAAHFQAAPTPSLIRFSNASGDPNSDDWQRDSRGMAVRFRPPGGDEADILAVTTPVFVLRTPEDFLQFIRLRKPDPETGQPDWEELGAFLADHPEAQTAVQWTLNAEPPASFATQIYHSPHTFRLLDAHRDPTLVRYRWRPEAGEATIPDDEAKARGRDYLRAELAARLAGDPVRFDLKLQIPVEEDPIDDPTAAWPDDRERVNAGRLEITELMDDPERGDHIEVFDPTRTGDGIELSEDPILQARPRAYSVSAYRRLGVEVDDPSIPPPS
jgi:catalase